MSITRSTCCNWHTSLCMFTHRKFELRKLKNKDPNLPAFGRRDGMDKEAGPVDKPQLQKLRLSRKKYQRNATLKLNDTICSGIAGIVKQVAIIQVFQCTALRSFFGSFNQRNNQLLTLFDAKVKKSTNPRAVIHY